MNNDPQERPSTAVFDKGRRGNPLNGCDCVQCFGYCMVNGDEAVRVQDNGNRKGDDDERLHRQL